MSLRQEIIIVSKELLLKGGFAQLSMRKIAKKAGVTATSIYLYFKNKDELLLALVEESIEKLTAVLKDALDPSAGPWNNLKGWRLPMCNMHSIIRRSTKSSIW